MNIELQLDPKLKGNIEACKAAILYFSEEIEKSASGESGRGIQFLNGKPLPESFAGMCLTLPECKAIRAIADALIKEDELRAEQEAITGKKSKT